MDWVINLGNEGSGNFGQVHINPEQDLAVFIQKLASENNQGTSMYILKLLLTANSKKAEEFWKENPERLKYLIDKYSKSIVKHMTDKQENHNGTSS